MSQVEQEHYLQGWKGAEKLFTFDCWVCILRECVNSSMNFQLLSHLINNFRNYSNEKFRQGALTKEKYIRGLDALASAIDSKCQKGTVEQKISLIDGLFLLLQYTTKKVGHKDAKWNKVLEYYEKEINQSLDYLNAKRQSDVRSGHD